MSRFREELRAIPTAAWFLAVAAYLAIATLLVIFSFAGNKDFANWTEGGKLALAFTVGIVPFIYVLLIGYVFGDAKHRGMHYIMWTLLAIFIPNAIGIILYFLLRTPMAKTCSACAAKVKVGSFCSQCGAALQATCPSCKRGVEPGWSHCPHCGTTLPTGPRAGS
jgi:Double zinc ribbon